MKLPPNNYEFLILSYKAIKLTSMNLKLHLSAYICGCMARLEIFSCSVLCALPYAVLQQHLHFGQWPDFLYFRVEPRGWWCAPENCQQILCSSL